MKLIGVVKRFVNKRSRCLTKLQPVISYSLEPHNPQAYIIIHQDILNVYTDAIRHNTLHV